VHYILISSNCDILKKNKQVVVSERESVECRHETKVRARQLHSQSIELRFRSRIFANLPINE